MSRRCCGWSANWTCRTSTSRPAATSAGWTTPAFRAMNPHGKVPVIRTARRGLGVARHPALPGRDPWRGPLLARRSRRPRAGRRLDGLGADGAATGFPGRGVLGRLSHAEGPARRGRRGAGPGADRPLPDPGRRLNWPISRSWSAKPCPWPTSPSGAPLSLFRAGDRAPGLAASGGLVRPVARPPGLSPARDGPVRPSWRDDWPSEPSGPAKSRV
jgi:hypothetical protein